MTVFLKRERSEKKITVQFGEQHTRTHAKYVYNNNSNLLSSMRSIESSGRQVMPAHWHWWVPDSHRACPVLGVLAIGNGASSKVGSFKATKRGQTNGIGWIAAPPGTVGGLNVPIGHEEPFQKIGVVRFPTERVDIGDPLNGQQIIRGGIVHGSVSQMGLQKRLHPNLSCKGG